MKLSWTSHFGFVSLLCLYMVSCDELFEEDISNDSVELLAPVNNGTMDAGTIEFWWNEIEAATEYKFIMVKGSFDSPTALLQDSNLNQNMHTVFLESGQYEWKIIAMNAGSLSESEPFLLTVDSTFSLSSERIVPKSPANDACTNDTSLLLSWIDPNIPNIRYLVDVRIGAFEDDLNILSYETEQEQLQVAIPKEFEGLLSWGVRAVSDYGASPYTSRTFNLDLTNPSAASLLSPAVQDTVQSTNVQFSWSATLGTGCSEYDSILIYDDSSSLTPVHKSHVSESTNSYTTSLNAGTYWWEVFRYDSAGNHNKNSGLRKFYAEP